MDRPRRQKQPEETRTLPFEFASKLVTGDHLVGSVPSAGTPSSTPAGLTFGTPARTGDVVTLAITGGDDGQDYVVDLQWPTQGGDTPRLDALIEVRSDQN